MITIDTKRKEWPGVWSTYRHGVRTQIRPVTKDVYVRFQSEAIREDMDSRGQIGKNIDDAKLDRLLFDYMIEAWEGFLDPQQKPLACDIKNKLAVINAIPDYGVWVLKQSETIGLQYEKLIADQEKNLKASRDGKKTGNDTGLQAAGPAGT